MQGENFLIKPFAYFVDLTDSDHLRVLSMVWPVQEKIVGGDSWVFDETSYIAGNSRTGQTIEDLFSCNSLPMGSSEDVVYTT